MDSLLSVLRIVLANTTKNVIINKIDITPPVKVEY